MGNESENWGNISAFWNGYGAAYCEAVSQAVQNPYIGAGGRAFTSVAANVASTIAFTENVFQSLIDSQYNPSPEMVTQIENQGVQFLTQMVGEELGASLVSLAVSTALTAAGVTAAAAPYVVAAAVVGAVAGAFLGSKYGDQAVTFYNNFLKPNIFIQ
jgi:hypothetical protein